MNDSVGVLIAVALGVILVATLLFLVIPEPAGRAVVATERLDVAVLAFRNSSSWSNGEETLRSRVESRLVNATGVDVYSRAQLDALLMERALSDTGITNPTTAIEIGTLTGVTKLIGGTVYAITTTAEETTMCGEWVDGDCVETIPATTYRGRVLAQIEVIDARTGHIEQSMDVGGTGSTTVRSGSLFDGYDALLAKASSEIADAVAEAVTSTYTRELRYGLYHAAEPKRDGYVGQGTSSRFSKDDAPTLIVHFTRIRDDDLFDVVWVAPDGTAIQRVEDVVDVYDWRVYELDLAGLPSGRYRVQGFLNGTAAFDQPFSVAP